MMFQKRVFYSVSFVVVAAIYLLFINVIGWFSDMYEDIVLFTTLGIVTVLLIKRSEELQRLQEYQKQMLLDISHNLQTPLAVFQTRLEILKVQAPYDTVIQKLERSLEELSVFISDLLRLAQLENTAGSPYIPFNLSQTVEDLIEEIRIVAEDRGIHIHHYIEPDIRVSGEEARIREVILGLASNAMKYTRTGVQKTISFSLTRETGTAVLKVEDNGIGIKKEDLPHIFERFWRARGTEHVGGSGLGLALAKHVVERHGGALAATSQFGKGTTLSVRLPLIS